VLLSVLLGFLARWQFLSRLARYAETTPWAADTAVIASMRWPLPTWCLLGGVYAATRIVSIPPVLARTLEKVLLSVLIISVSVWVASLLGRLLELRGVGAGGARAASGTGVVRTLVKIGVIAVGTLILLSALGISVTPLLTTMGLGGLAVAFGLRETLANLFSGMNFTLAGNINVGDFVKLGSGQEGHEGYIEDIQWRVTRVRTLFDTIVVIPNSQLADSIVTNYHQPSSDALILVPVGVHVASDLEHVERVTCRVARQIMETIPGGTPGFEPSVRYKAFGDSSIDFWVILRVRQYPDFLLVRHEFIKALVRAFAEEGIVIPFPVRALNLAQEDGARAGDGRGVTSADSPPPPRFDEH
jgi:small-conductance mechanosensitive channel